MLTDVVETSLCAQTLISAVNVGANIDLDIACRHCLGREN